MAPSALPQPNEISDTPLMTNDDNHRSLQRLSEMGIQAKLMNGGGCVIASMPLDPEPFETLSGSRTIERVVFSVVGRDQIKCLRPRMLFQLPLMRLGGCGDRSAIEGRIRFRWNHHMTEMKRARARLGSVGVETTPCEDGSLLRFSIEGEAGGTEATMVDSQRLVLPGTGRLSGRALQPGDRVFQISDGIETGVDLSIAVSTRLEELGRLHDQLDEQTRRHAILDDAREAKEATRGRAHRVLLVGGRITKERRCVDSLRLRGYEVECAATARQAMEAFQSSSPELVIADFELGRYEGLELIPTLRQMAGVEEVPVVVIDTKPRETRREAARQVGAAGYLTYPVSIPKIAAHLENLVSRPQRRFTRFHPRISVRVAGGPDSWVATALSRGGMFLATESKLAAEEVHDFELLLPGTGEPLRVESEVLYRTSGAGREASGLGLRFNAFPDGDEALLIRYIATL